ncbi:hypothetical protein MsAg5_10050 [Methanosarcinaceae archaeon Ag5]|uniref:Uncharacterized protein n=1 Tax=Methanolapillus africanus TaxID=3028297 RepID=A0AAE4SD35_9EURY|nr:hypothetical protein [Methanosarcinaceae archaeon Ag5]
MKKITEKVKQETVKCSQNKSFEKDYQEYLKWTAELEKLGIEKNTYDILMPPHKRLTSSGNKIVRRI